MTTLLIRTFTAALEVRADGDGRTLAGTIVPYGTETRIGGYTESFAPGAFQGADPAELPLMATHERENLPIGRAAELRDEAAGWWGAFRVSETRLGDEVLTLVRDGALSGLSIGFIPITDRWSRDRTRVERVRAQAHHVAVVAFPAYDGARIEAVRAALTPATPRLHLARLRRAA